MATTAKSPVGATSPRVGHDRGSGAPSYFPQQQQYHEGLADAETLSNTLANAHIAQAQLDNNTHLAAPVATRPNGRFTEEWDASQRGSSIVVDGVSPVNNMHRTSSFAGSVIGDGSISLSRGNTLKKKASLRRAGSLKRSGSRRSMKAGSVRSLALQSSSADQDPSHSAFYCPVPTSGTPTEVLANRFQAWRKILKDLITYFREIQIHYEHRAKSLLKLANVLNNTATPPGFLASGGIDDALQILRNYNKQAILESNKAKEIEEDVILALTGLRSDLHQKIKEIKNLSGDFKNSVDKEMETTRRAVNNLQEVLGQTELDSALTTGKQDPYILRLHVDRQLERQIDEENYLHQAYLNLENSGRELESIVVGEIQKSYNAYASILKRESDAAYSAVEELRVGPISMPKDTEWTSFIQRDDRFVDPDMPMRTAESIHYPGRDHYACQEIRAGLLERKSKYLKSYTAGWYVLSPTHLHEFKSADKTQAPVMSLYLPEQKLGSHSAEGGKSNKFVLKGRQTGSMHRGHTWVFRAESHDTMMAWYDDIRALTERTPEERSNFLRGHIRSISRASARSSISSDGVGDDDEEPPFTGTAVAANHQQQQQPRQETLPRRPSGGRFPSDLQVNAQRGLQVSVSPISVSSGYYENGDAELAAAVTALPSNGVQNPYVDGESGHATGFYRDGPSPSGPRQDGYGAYPVQHANSTGYGKAPSPITAGVAGTPNNFVPGAPQNGAVDRPVSGALVAADGEAAMKRRSGSQLSNEDELSSGGPVLKPSQEQRVQGMNGAAATEQHRGASGMRPDEKSSRPGGGATRNDSIPTISNLHIPGEYPRGPSTSSR